jgi:hypothetical protein
MKNTLFQICKAIVILALLWCCFLFAGCYTKRQAIEKFCKADTTSTFTSDTLRAHKRDTLYLKGDSIVIHDTIKADCINGKPVFKPLQRTERKGRIKSVLNIDSSGAIKIDCLADSLMHVIDSLNSVITNDTKTTITVHNEPTWLETVHAARYWLLIAFVAGFALAIYVKLRS